MIVQHLGWTFLVMYAHKKFRYFSPLLFLVIIGIGGHLEKSTKSYRTWQDLMDHTQPNKTIQHFAQPYRTKESNTVMHKYDPLKALT